MENNGKEYAFPVAASYTDENPEVLQHTGGLTKRELIAAMAMQGIMASMTSDINKWTVNGGYLDHADISKESIKAADELLSQLNKQP